MARKKQKVKMVSRNRDSGLAIAMATEEVVA